MAQLPSIRHKSGILEIRTPVSNSKRWQMVCNSAPPPKNILDSWKRQVSYGLGMHQLGVSTSQFYCGISNIYGMKLKMPLPGQRVMQILMLSSSLK